MKRKPRHQVQPANGQRLHRNFRLRPDIADALQRHSVQTRRSKTAIVEMALEAHLGGAK